MLQMRHVELWVRQVTNHQPPDEDQTVNCFIIIIIIIIIIILFLLYFIYLFIYLFIHLFIYAYCKFYFGFIKIFTLHESAQIKIFKKP